MMNTVSSRKLITLGLSFVGGSFCYEKVLGPFVRVLAEAPLFTPERFAPEEGDWRPFDEQELFGWAEGVEGDYLLLDRKKRIRYEATLHQSLSGGASIHVDGKTKPKDWGAVFELGDRLADAYQPQIGWVQIILKRSYPLKTEVEMKERLMEACVDGVRYRDWGASGLAMRTYLGSRIVDLLGRELLLSTPAVVQELPWGGVRIDLVPEPWTASDETLVEARTRAMSHLAPAKVFATGSVHANGAVELVRGERFPKEWMDEPGRP